MVNRETAEAGQLRRKPVEHKEEAEQLRRKLVEHKDVLHAYCGLAGNEEAGRLNAKSGSRLMQLINHQDFQTKAVIQRFS